METLNKKTLGFPFKSFFKMFIQLTVMLVLAACGNNGGSDAPPGNVVVGSCLNCAGLTNPLSIATFNSESLYMNQWPVQLMNMQLFVNGTNYVPGTSSAYNNYIGVMSVQGQMNVTGGVALRDAMGTCILSPGVYAVQTESQGMISMGADLSVSLTTGAIRMRMTAAPYIGGSMLVNEGGSIRWKGRLEIVSVNGQMCNSFYSDMR